MAELQGGWGVHRAFPQVRQGEQEAEALVVLGAQDTVPSAVVVREAEVLVEVGQEAVVAAQEVPVVVVVVVVALKVLPAVEVEAAEAMVESVVAVRVVAERVVEERAVGGLAAVVMVAVARVAGRMEAEEAPQVGGVEAVRAALQAVAVKAVVDMAQGLWVAAERVVVGLGAAEMVVEEMG